MAPPLTPEEKKALQAAKKEEKKQQQIEYAKQLKRDYLGRELKYSKLTLQRHERKWRQMLINLALPKMREDLEYAWHNFDRVNDCKDFTISLMLDEIRDAEEQRMMNVRNHVEHIDKLMELFRERIDELEEDYERQIIQRIQEGAQDAEELKLSAEEEETYCKTLSYMLSVYKKRHEQNARTEYFSKFEEVEIKHQRAINRVRDVLEKKIKYLNDSLRFLRQYDHDTMEKKKEHDELKAQDDDIQILMVNQLEKIRKTCEYIKVLKVKLVDSKEVLGRKLKDIKVENEFFEYAFSTLKKKLEIAKTKDVRKITYLTINVNSNLENLGKLRDKVESILRISTLCRKLETQKEKVQAFPVSPVDESAALLMSSDKTEEHLPALDLFWQRVAQVDASRYAINEERECLKKENDFLKRKIYEYCECVTCPMPNKNLVQKGIKHITEGALEQKKYEKQKSAHFVSNGYSDIDE